MLMLEHPDGTLLNEPEHLLFGCERPNHLFCDLPEKAPPKDVRAADEEFRRRMRVDGGAGLVRIFSDIIRTTARHIAQNGEADARDPLEDVGREDCDPRRTREVVLDAIALATEDKMRRLSLLVARDIKAAAALDVADMLVEAARAEADSKARKKAENRQRAPNVKSILVLISNCVEAISERPYTIEAVKARR